jgi:hypothetical protein
MLRLADACAQRSGSHVLWGSGTSVQFCWSADLEGCHPAVVDSIDIVSVRLGWVWLYEETGDDNDMIYAPRPMRCLKTSFRRRAVGTCPVRGSFTDSN